MAESMARVNAGDVLACEGANAKFVRVVRKTAKRLVVEELEHTCEVTPDHALYTWTPTVPLRVRETAYARQVMLRPSVAVHDRDRACFLGFGLVGRPARFHVWDGQPLRKYYTD